MFGMKIIFFQLRKKWSVCERKFSPQKYAFFSEYDFWSANLPVAPFTTCFERAFLNKRAFNDRLPLIAACCVYYMFFTTVLRFLNRKLIKLSSRSADLFLATLTLVSGSRVLLETRLTLSAWPLATLSCLKAVSSQNTATACLFASVFWAFWIRFSCSNLVMNSSLSWYVSYISYLFSLVSILLLVCNILE